LTVIDFVPLAMGLLPQPALRAEIFWTSAASSTSVIEKIDLILTDDKKNSD